MFATSFFLYLAVHLFIDSLFTFMDGSDMLCHVPLETKSFITLFTHIINTQNLPFWRTFSDSVGRECF